MHQLFRSALGVALTAVMVWFANPEIMAQELEEGDEDPAVFEEILVTASKRGAVAVQDMAMSIQAFSGDDFERRGVVEFDDYAYTVSGMTFQDQGPGDKKYVLRGMQSTGAATTGVYLDDIVITGNNRQDGGGRQPDIRLVDMERIEVLKGPQGTLYGASSMSGTIRMLTNKPDATEFDGMFNGMLGGTEGASGANYDIDGMVNIPLAQDRVALRLVGYYSEKAGYIDNTLDYGVGGFGGDGMNNVTLSGGRAALRWLVNDDVTVDAMWIHQDTETDGAAWYQPLFGDFIIREYQPLTWDEGLDAFNLALEWDTDHGVFSASGSYMEREIFYQFPATRILCTIFFTINEPECFSPGPDPKPLSVNGQLRQPQERTILSSELRYASNWNGRFQMVGGLFYQKEENDFTSLITYNNVDGTPKPIDDRQNIQLHRTVNGQIEQMAAFAEVSLDITEKLTATVGLRVFEFEIDEVGQNRAARNRPVDAAPVHTNSTEDDITPKFNLAYDVTDDFMVYTTYAEGYRSGGNNEPDFATGQSFPSYGSDSLKSYELGVKGAAQGGRFQYDAAAYYMDWADLQARTIASFETGPFLILANVGEAEITGLELGSSYVSVEGTVVVGGTLTFMNAELTEDELPSGNPFPAHDGDPIPEVPDFTGNVFMEYHFPAFSGNWDATARLDYAYVGESRTTFRSDDPRSREIGDYSLVNIRLTTEHAEGKYRVGLFIDNLFDEFAPITTFVDANRRRPDQVTPTRPFTIGINFGYRF